MEAKHVRTAGSSWERKKVVRSLADVWPKLKWDYTELSMSDPEYVSITVTGATREELALIRKVAQHL